MACRIFNSTQFSYFLIRFAPIGHAENLIVQHKAVNRVTPTTAGHVMKLFSTVHCHLKIVDTHLRGDDNKEDIATVCVFIDIRNWSGKLPPGSSRSGGPLGNAGNARPQSGAGHEALRVSFHLNLFSLATGADGRADIALECQMDKSVAACVAVAFGCGHGD
jgi:hypothetical protein